MLSFDIRSLDRQAARVDGQLAAGDPIWEEGDPLPAEAIRATGRLSNAGAGRFYWSGRIQGCARSTCRRCLTTAEASVADDVHIIFVEADDEEADDPDVFRIPARATTLDLRPAIREQWMLSVPSYALCREDCNGFCPNCGADLNAGSCDCEKPTDDRLHELRSLRGDSVSEI